MTGCRALGTACGWEVFEDAETVLYPRSGGDHLNLPTCENSHRAVHHKKANIMAFIDTYIYIGILCSHKKEWALAICDYRNRPIAHYAK